MLKDNEELEIYTSDGRPTGVKKSRELIHQVGDWHISAHLWICSQSKVLLQQRSSTKKTHPIKWSSAVGGHISFGEDIQKGIIRETQEEINLTLQEKKIQFLFRYPYTCIEDDIFSRDRQWIYIYLYHFDDEELIRQKIKPNEEELNALNFFTWKEFISIFHHQNQSEKKIELVPHNKEYLYFIDLYKKNYFHQ